MLKTITADIFTVEMYQLFGRKKCRDTAKAERFLKERKIQYQFVDMDKKPVSLGELKSILASVKAQDLIDTDSKYYKERNLEYLDFDPETELIENPDLMGSPVLRKKGQALKGFNLNEYLSFTRNQGLKAES